MKKIIMLKALKFFGIRVKKFRKIKILGVVMFVGFLSCSSFVVWKSLSILDFLKNEHSIIQISSMAERFSKELGSQSNFLYGLLTVDCWNKLVGLTNSEYWHHTLAIEYFNNLKNICFPKLFDAEGPESSVAGQSIEYIQRSAI